MAHCQSTAFPDNKMRPCWTLPESEMSRDLIHATHLNNVFGSWGCIDPSDLNTFVPYASSGPVVNTLQTSHDLIDVPSCSWEAGISTDTLSQLKVIISTIPSLSCKRLLQSQSTLRAIFPAQTRLILSSVHGRQAAIRIRRLS